MFQFHFFFASFWFSSLYCIPDEYKQAQYWLGCSWESPLIISKVITLKFQFSQSIRALSTKLAMASPTPPLLFKNKSN